MKTFDYINRVNLTLPLSVYEGTSTHSPPLIAMHLLDRSCVIIGIFLKYCVPQQIDVDDVSPVTVPEIPFDEA